MRRLVLGTALPPLAWLRDGRWIEAAAAAACWSLIAVALGLGLVRGVGGAQGWIAVAVALAALAGLHGAAWRRCCRTAAGPNTPWRRFTRNRTAVAGLAIVAVAYLVMGLAPLLAPYEPQAQIELASNYLAPPSSQHPFGTDRVARDVFSRLLFGARISLTIGLVAAFIAVGLGTALGAVAAWSGHWVDGVLMRLADMVTAFPRLVLLLVVLALADHRSIYLVMVVIGLTCWMDTARLVRGEVLSLRQREYVLAARAMGLGAPRIIARHVVPNALGPVLVSATLLVANVIQLEAGLSFLGLGVSPPTAAWGSMVSDGVPHLLRAPWIAASPALAIVLSVVAIQLVGDGLRDALDPQS
jgi:peptide/nickel transport system permease protein